MAHRKAVSLRSSSRLLPKSCWFSSIFEEVRQSRTRAKTDKEWLYKEPIRGKVCPDMFIGLSTTCNLFGFQSWNKCTSGFWQILYILSFDDLFRSDLKRALTVVKCGSCRVFVEFVDYFGNVAKCSDVYSTRLLLFTSSDKRWHLSGHDLIWLCIW